MTKAKRPPTRTVVVGVRFTPETLEDLKQLAQEQGRGYSNLAAHYVTLAVKAAMEAKEKKQHGNI